MKTLLLTCPCDSIVANICSNLNACYPKVIEASTNSEDVAIAAIICGSIAAIVLILVLGFLAWRLIELHAKKNVEGRKRIWDIEDKNRKQKYDLLDYKLKMQKEICDTDAYKKACCDDEKVNDNPKNIEEAKSKVENKKENQDQENKGENKSDEDNKKNCKKDRLKEDIKKYITTIDNAIIELEGGKTTQTNEENHNK